MSQKQQMQQSQQQLQDNDRYLGRDQEELQRRLRQQRRSDRHVGQRSSISRRRSLRARARPCPTSQPLLRPSRSNLLPMQQ
eukprot:8280669-Pyramimonas_sp.AAC.2